MTPEDRALVMQLLSQVADIVNNDGVDPQDPAQAQGAAQESAPAAAPAAGAAAKEVLLPNSVAVPVSVLTPVDGGAPVADFIAGFIFDVKERKRK